MDNKKPLREWTLGELQAHCNDANCDKCVWRDATDCAFAGCPPCEWNLTDPPSWTREDIEDAKAVKRIYPCAVKVERSKAKRGMVNLITEDWYYAVHRRLFPSLVPGECVPLQEILDAEEGLREK